MKTPYEIEVRIRQLAALRARADAVKPGHPLGHELEIEISGLRWVLGEMDEDMMGVLIETVPGSRARYEPRAETLRAPPATRRRW
jgi:hypothetical protein